MELIDLDKQVLYIPTTPLQSESMASGTFTIRNITKTFVAFKVKTTNKLRYIVRPNIGVVPPHGSSQIFISLQPTPKPPEPGPSRDKFMVNVVEAPELADGELTSGFWAHRTDDRAVRNVKLSVEFGPNLSPLQSSGLPELSFPRDESISLTGRISTPTTSPSTSSHVASYDVFRTSFSLLGDTSPRSSLASHLIDKRVLRFHTGPLPSGSTANDTLTISNAAKTPLAFKVMTTNQNRYVVRPNMGVIPPHGSTHVSISLQPSSRPPKPGVSHDKFMIRVVEAPELPDIESVHDFWTQHKHDDSVRNTKLKVQFLRYLHSTQAPDLSTTPHPRSKTKRLSETGGMALTLLTDPKPMTDVPRRRFGMIVDVDKRVLCFPVCRPGVVSCDSLTVSNAMSKPVAFKIKTNNPRRYIVRPSMGFIPPHGSFVLLIGVRLKSDETQPGPSPDKILLQVIEAPEITDSDLAREFWTQYKGHDVENIKFPVEFVRERCEARNSSSTMRQSGSGAERQGRFRRLMTGVLGCINGVHSRSSRLLNDDHHSDYPL